MEEFIKSRTKKIEEESVNYCRVNFNAQLEHFEKKELLKTQNDPFNYVIKKSPNIVLKESLALMYEEVN